MLFSQVELKPNKNKQTEVQREVVIKLEGKKILSIKSIF